MNYPIAPAPVFRTPLPEPDRCDICGSATELDVCGACRNCVDGVDHE